jgi:hypothetical protein
MSLFEKGGFFAIIGVYIIIQIFTIATEYSSPITILIKKENYRKEIDSVTHDSIVYDVYKQFKTYEAFHVKVKAKTFWDKLLLTNEDGNLMSEIFKIATSLALARYIFRLQPENVFTGKSLTYFWLTALLFIGIPESYSIGAEHTRDFWRDYYISKGGTNR